MAPAAAALPTPTGGPLVLAPAVVSQTHSSDSVAVFERTGDVYYAIYGHVPKIPIPLTTTLAWSWWSMDAVTATDTATRARPLFAEPGIPEHRPDVAFSREGYVMAVWGRTIPLPQQFFCLNEIGDPNLFPRFRGDLKSARLVPLPGDNVEWRAGPNIIAATTMNEDHFYHNPSVTVDSNGVALMVFIHTVITYANPCGISIKMRVLSRRWDGTDWIDERVINGFEPTPNGPSGYYAGARFHYTDIATTAKLSTDAVRRTRQQAIAVWYDFITTDFVCFAFHDIYWPKYSVWNGDSWTPAAEVPGRPTQPPYMKYLGEKLGISTNQFGDAMLAFGNERDLDPCATGDLELQVRTSAWSSATQSFSAAVMLDGGGSPDVAVDQANQTIAAYATYPVKWATASVTGSWTLHGHITTPPPSGSPAVASLAPAANEAERQLVIQTDGTWTQRVGAGAWSMPVPLDGAPFEFPEIAARTGSPSLPHAEWSFLSYFAADNNLHTAIAGGDRGEQVGVGANALVNLVTLADPLTAWFGGWAGGPPVPAPPAPYASGAVRYEVYPGGGPSGGIATLKDVGELNSGAPALLSDFLAWALVFYPAQRYIVDVGDHGKGWRGVCQDFTQANSWIDMPELRSAFINVKGGSTHRWDVIAFSACLMAQLEVAYQFNGYADYMVASEELMPGAGHNYADLLPRLMATPFMTTPLAARTFVTSYAIAHAGGAGLSQQLDTLSAVDVSQAPLLAVDSGLLATAITTWIEDLTITTTTRAQRVNAVKAARNASDTFPHPSRNHGAMGYRDLGDFATRMITALTPDDPTTALDNSVRSWASLLSTTLGSAVLQYFNDVSRPNARGLAVYLESSSAAYSVAANAYTRTHFVSVYPEWHNLISTTLGTLDTLASLQLGTGEAWLQVDTMGGSVGVPYSDSTRCDGLCGVTLDGGRCLEEEGSTTLLIPGSVRRFSWRIDGTYNTAALPYTLTIRTLKDGGVIKQFSQLGVLAAGQVIEGIYIVPYNAFLPNTRRTASDYW